MKKRYIVLGVLAVPVALFVILVIIGIATGGSGGGGSSGGSGSKNQAKVQEQLEKLAFEARDARGRGDTAEAERLEAEILKLQEPAAAKAVKQPTGAAPVTDFEYGLSKVAEGIVIKKYTGGGGKVIIPSVIEDMPVVEIGHLAFCGHGNTWQYGKGDYYPANDITEIVVPASVVAIESQAFYNMGSLATATLPDNLKKIPRNCFDGCKNLATVNLPKSLEVIEPAAFSGCTNLSNLIIPGGFSGVKFEAPSDYGYIPAFAGCNKLPIKTRQAIQSWGYTGNLGL